LDTVMIRGVNDDELADLIEFGKRVPAEVRFIEYMDVGGATRWSPDQVMSRTQMLDVLERRYGRIEPVVETSTAPADRFRLPDGTVFGIIASTTAPFCADCDRSRLTADGLWYLCLYAMRGIDLRGPLRGGASNAQLKALITGGWSARTDRGAEAGLAQRPELTMLGRTYASGFEQDLEEWLFLRPRRTVLNPAWPWAIWYPLRRTGAFGRLSPKEQGEIIREHSILGRAYGDADLAHDVRLACHGLDVHDNDFVIGLIGRELHPLSHLVQTMRKTAQTSQYLQTLGPFFVGHVRWQSAAPR